MWSRTRATTKTTETTKAATAALRLRCFACRERRFWRSIHGRVVCGVCHPPAEPWLVERWLHGPENDAVADPVETT